MEEAEDGNWVTDESGAEAEDEEETSLEDKLKLEQLRSKALESRLRALNRKHSRSSRSGASSSKKLQKKKKKSQRSSSPSSSLSLSSSSCSSSSSEEDLSDSDGKGLKKSKFRVESYEDQYVLNSRLLSRLRRVKSSSAHGSRKTRQLVEKCISSLRERQEWLAIADEYGYETAKAYSGDGNLLAALDKKKRKRLQTSLEVSGGGVRKRRYAKPAFARRGAPANKSTAARTHSVWPNHMVQQPFLGGSASYAAGWAPGQAAGPQHSQQQQQPSVKLCHACQQPGHFVANCPQRKLQR